MLRNRNQIQERRNAELQSDVREYEQLVQDDPVIDELTEAVEKQLKEFKNAFEEFRSKTARNAQEKDG